MRYCSGSKHNRVSGINKQSSWANDFTWHHGDTDIRLRVMGNSWNDTMTTFSPQYRPYWNKLYCKTIMVLHCNFKWNDTQNPIKKLALARSELDISFYLRVDHLLKHPSVHSFLINLSGIAQSRIAGGLGPVPAAEGWEVGYTLDRSPVYWRDSTQTSIHTYKESQTSKRFNYIITPKC